MSASNETTLKATTFSDLARKSLELRKEVREHGKGLYLEAVKGFMMSHPEVAIFSFYQYTPTFNDGDPCYNYVCGPYVMMASDPWLATTGEHKGYINEDCVSVDTPDELRAAIKELAPDELLESIFGTNTCFIARRKGDEIVIKEGYYDPPC